MEMRLRLYDLDTENGAVTAYSAVMEVESPEEAEESDAYYDLAMEWAAEDLGCEVYSYEYYEWEEVENEPDHL